MAFKGCPESTPNRQTTENKTLNKMHSTLGPYSCLERAGGPAKEAMAGEPVGFVRLEVSVGSGVR